MEGTFFAKTQGLFCKFIPSFRLYFQNFASFFPNVFSVFMTRTVGSGGGEGGGGRPVNNKKIFHSRSFPFMSEFTVKVIFYAFIKSDINTSTTTTCRTYILYNMENLDV